MINGQRRFVLAIALIAAAVLGVTVYSGRKALWRAWWHWRAVRECREPGFDPEKPPPPGWRAIINAGEEGYPALANLLCDPDPKVTESAWQFIDAGCGTREDLVEYLRRNSTLATVRYLLPNPQKRPGSEWRAAAIVNLGDSSWYFYWSGEGRTHLEPSPEAIEFLESRRGPLQDGNRALDGLAALLKPGEVPSPQSPLATRIVEILAKAGRQESSVEAVRLLALRSAPPAEVRQRFRIPSRGEWTDFSRGLPLEYSPPADYQCREALLSLCHFDDVWTLMVIARLLRNPEARPALEAMLAESPRLGSLEMPRWLPHLEAARRFFARSPLQRGGAAGFLVEENLQEGRSLIQDAMAGEGNGDLTLYYCSCLLALGDETQREPVRQFFKKILKKSASGPIGPPRMNTLEFDLRQEDLARNLLLSGDLLTLEWVISSHSVVSLDLDDFIHDLPLELRRPKNSWDSAIEAVRDQKLVKWWAANKARIAFDPARRKFFTR